MNTPKLFSNGSGAATGGTPLRSANFAFLADHRPLLVSYAAMAERYLVDDPNTALIKLRQFAELLAECVADYCEVPIPIDAKLTDVLESLKGLPIVPRPILDRFHKLRKAGNEAAHHHKGTCSEAREQLRNAHTLGVWFHRSFSDKNFAKNFVEPSSPTSMEAVDRLQQLEQELDAQRGEHQRLEQELRQREAQLKDLESKKGLTEDECQRLASQRDELQAKLQTISADAGQSQAAVRTSVEQELAVKMQELEGSQKRLEEHRQQVARYREQLSRADRESTQQGNRLQQLEQELEGQRREHQRLEQELLQREAQVKALEGKQGQTELEYQRLASQRDQLLAKLQGLSAGTGQPQATIRDSVKKELAAKSKELEQSQKRLEEHRQQLASYREQLVDFQQRVENDKVQLQNELEDRTKKLSDMERANHRLWQLLMEQRGKAPNPHTSDQCRPGNQRWKRILVLALVGLGILVCCAGGVWFVKAVFSGSGSGTTNSHSSSRDVPSTPTTYTAHPPSSTQRIPGQPTSRVSTNVAGTTKVSPPTAQNPIHLEDAQKWIGKACVLEMTVRSTKDLGWAVVLNSKVRYTDADNLRITIVADSAGKQFREQGVTDLEEHFLRSLIQVSGTVEEKTDNRTGKKYLEIQVKKASQITKR